MNLRQYTPSIVLADLDFGAWDMSFQFEDGSDQFEGANATGKKDLEDHGQEHMSVVMPRMGCENDQCGNHGGLYGHGGMMLDGDVIDEYLGRPLDTRGTVLNRGVVLPTTDVSRQVEEDPYAPFIHMESSFVSQGRQEEAHKNHHDEQQESRGMKRSFEEYRNAHHERTASSSSSSLLCETQQQQQHEDASMGSAALMISPTSLSDDKEVENEERAFYKYIAQVFSEDSDEEDCSEISSSKNDKEADDVQQTRRRRKRRKKLQPFEVLFQDSSIFTGEMNAGPWQKPEEKLLFHIMYCFVNAELRVMALVAWRCGILRPKRAIEKKIKRTLRFSKWRERDVESSLNSIVQVLKDNFDDVNLSQNELELLEAARVDLLNYGLESQPPFRQQ